MLARTFSAINVGFDPIKIEVELYSKQGVPGLTIIGLPTKAVEEARERVTSALLNCGIKIRNRKTIVNLAPADIRKTSSSLELAIAVGLLKLYKEINQDLGETILLGELSLDGSLKPAKGVISIVMAAKQWGFKEIILPIDNYEEVKTIKGISIRAISHLKEIINYKKNRIDKKHPSSYNQSFKVLSSVKIKSKKEETNKVDFSDIVGQIQAKRVLEIAAAGGHNIMMVGPPGSGKSLLAKSLVSILPPLDDQEVIDVNRIHTLVGSSSGQIIRERPYRAPHHTISRIGLVGGSNKLVPGEISLAHGGILFLDELSEFSRSTIELLRQPLEDGEITLSKSQGSTTYPARFIFVAASNPCPCGYINSNNRKCYCNRNDVLRYRKKISGPILDRIDLFIWVKELSAIQLGEIGDKKFTKENSLSAKIKKRVGSVRKIQQNRSISSKEKLNANLSNSEIRKVCNISDGAKQVLKSAVNKFNLSARSYLKIIKVAQTIADLALSEKILGSHVSEALEYRQHESWYG